MPFTGPQSQGERMLDGKHQGILGGQYRALTLGIVLSVTVGAFGQMAVTTVAPAIAEDLGGLALYGWIFSAAGLASFVGAIAAGRQVDRRGPGATYLIGLAVSGLGMLVAAVAPGMAVLTLGRVLQGLGGGATFTCVYAGINLAYPDELRPRMLAVVSSAFIVPAMVGPYLAGVIAEQFTWRVVF
ncbi:MAG: MFS transporter [Chloroflexota bacterium]|nr:MFS transporter [Chloroflexota bacterium]